MKNFLFLFTFLFFTFHFSLFSLLAAPPNPLVYDVGPLPPRLEKQVLGPRLPVPPGLRNLNQSIPAPGLVPTTGTAKVLVILIEFTDVKHTSSYTQSYFQNLIFSGTNSGSMYSYYKEVSYNQLFIDDGDGEPAVDNASNPTGWLTSSYTMRNYGEDGGLGIDNENGDIYALAQEAVELADSLIDFSQYDSDGDGTVDHVIIVHAGPAQEAGGGAYGTDAIWSHRWEIGGGATSGYLTNDGVYVKGYTMQAESSPVGIFAHEFGHDLGLPDFYNTITGAPGVGDWGLMDSGSWNGTPPGSSPAHPSAWSKIYLSWITPEVISNRQNSLSIYPVETTKNNGNKSIYKISIDVADDPTKEYFLISYRMKTGFDNYLPKQGLLIWHVDDSVGSIANNDVNNNPNHRRLDLEGPNKTNQSDIGSAFTEGDSFGSPDSRAYNGQDSGVTILGIGGVGNSYISSEVYKVEFTQALAFKNLINYPNPTYDGRTTISFTLTRPPTNRTIAIYDIAGELVRNVTSSDINVQSVDDNNVVYIYNWDGKNNSGENVFSGIYICVIKATDERQTGKIAIIK